jgi:signal transduction histidine kinase
MERLRILIVDDEAGMRLGVKRVLRDYGFAIPDFGTDIGFEVTDAESGEEALERFRQQPPDLLLLDHKLPGIQGLDLLDLVSREHRETLTVMVTAYASIETAISATRRGAFDFLAKPFTPTELKATVQKAARHLMLQRKARQLAREKRQLRFQLISVVSHELKSPLAAIEGYLQMLQDEKMGSDPKTRDHMIARSLIRLDGMRKLIFDLLDLTRIESGQRERSLREVDLVEHARLAVEAVESAASERQITIQLEAPATLSLQGDPTEIDSIFNNLVSNAVKYNKDGGSVVVTLLDDGHHRVIRVADTGIGLSKEERDKLFGEFVRIKNQKTKNILGSGLGLSILKRLAGLYQGDVSVESEPDVGSTFTVTLAKAPSPMATKTTGNNEEESG